MNLGEVSPTIVTHNRAVQILTHYSETPHHHFTLLDPVLQPQRHLQHSSSKSRAKKCFSVGT